MSLPLLFFMFVKDLHQLTQGVSTSVSEFELCAFLKQFLHFPYPAFIHIKEHVRTLELHSL